MKKGRETRNYHISPGRNLKKEDITVLAQLLTAMKDVVIKMTNAEKNNDLEQIAIAKKEIINFQKQIDKLL